LKNIVIPANPGPDPGRNPGFPMKTGILVFEMVPGFRRDDVWMPRIRVRGRLLRSGMTD